MAGSGSDGTEDSDSSAEREQANSSESDGNMPKRQRLTRASTRLSQSSQGQPTYPVKEHKILTEFLILTVQSTWWSDSLCLRYSRPEASG